MGGSRGALSVAFRYSRHICLFCNAWLMPDAVPDVVVCAHLRYLAPKLRQVEQRVLLVVGDGDLLLPSGEEGKRLEKLLPRCRLKAHRPIAQSEAHCTAHREHFPCPGCLFAPNDSLDQRRLRCSIS